MHVDNGKERIKYMRILEMRDQKLEFILSRRFSVWKIFRIHTTSRYIMKNISPIPPPHPPAQANYYCVRAGHCRLRGRLCRRIVSRTDECLRAPRAEISELYNLEKWRRKPWFELAKQNRNFWYRSTTREQVCRCSLSNKTNLEQMGGHPKCLCSSGTH